MIRSLTKGLKYVLLVSGLLFCALMSRIVYPYFSFSYDVDFLLTKQTILHNDVWRIAFYTHISSSLFVLLIGVFQFVKQILKKHPVWHRFLGKTYIILTLTISAPSGLIMSFYANGGSWARLSFVIVSALWWWYSYLAYKYAKEKNFRLHLANIYRSYSLTLSAITLRTYVFILPCIMNLHGKDMYIFVSWTSWIPNLIIAELLIRYSKGYKEFFKS